MSDQEEFFTVSGSSRYTGQSIRWIYRRLECGLLTRHKATDKRVTLIARSELDALMLPRRA